MTERLKIGLTWQLNTHTGWGVFATNVALALAARKDVELSFWIHELHGLNALDEMLLGPITHRCNAEVHRVRAGETLTFDGVLIHSDGNHFSGKPLEFPIQCEKHMGLMVFEDTAFTPDEIAKANAYDWLVTGSRWNQDILRGYGVESVCIQQGVDPTVFHPGPKSGRWRDRFVVFSGGKLEYRKGQDIVLAAFREFHKSHPEALLLTAWDNRWPQLVQDMTLNGHVEYEPVVTSEGVDIDGWFTDNGLPEGAALDIGAVPNALLGQIVREADVAVFMSRAEGGTNLMAMECIGAEVPTIVSRNTGHLDLNCWSVPCHSEPVTPSRFFDGIRGWGETSPRAVSELIEAIFRPEKGRNTDALLNDAFQIFDDEKLNRSVPTWSEYADQLVNLIRGD